MGRLKRQVKLAVPNSTFADYPDSPRVPVAPIFNNQQNTKSETTHLMPLTSLASFSSRTYFAVLDAGLI
jgi:hypothetical protein